MLRVRAHDARAAVVDDVGEVVGVEPVVDRDEHGTELRDRIERFELRVGVRCDVGDPVALADPKPLQRRRPFVGACSELLVGQPQVAVDHGFAVGVEVASAAHEVERRERGAHGAGLRRMSALGCRLGRRPRPSLPPIAAARAADARYRCSFITISGPFTRVAGQAIVPCSTSSVTTRPTSSSRIQCCAANCLDSQHRRRSRGTNGRGGSRVAGRFPACRARPAGRRGCEKAKSPDRSGLLRFCLREGGSSRAMSPLDAVPAGRFPKPCRQRTSLRRP